MNEQILFVFYVDVLITGAAATVAGCGVKCYESYSNVQPRRYFTPVSSAVHDQLAYQVCMEFVHYFQYSGLQVNVVFGFCVSVSNSLADTI